MQQCGEGFLSSYALEAPVCGKCLQKVKSLDSTIDHGKTCIKCGTQSVIYGKDTTTHAILASTRKTDGGFWSGGMML